MTAPLQRSSSCSSGKLEYDASDPIPEARALTTKMDKRPTKVDDVSAPTAKGDLKHLLHELRTMFQTDCALIQEDMHTLSGHMKSMEDESVMAHQSQLNTAILTQQLTQSEVSSDIGTEELPQYTRPLFSSLLLSKQVKSVLNEGLFRVCHLRGYMTAPLEDVIVAFRLIANKRAALSAIRERQPLDFEGSKLSFYEDLNSALSHGEHPSVP
ncbi:Hypothetical predicted protein [Pelobates cultripes]|uniref:Uncharacterized protein n=1 Tax=Pelobates cultripes TaxID=61616 RepID=A0AAD1WEF6_PELCU|nr:Hypothetical predicted protein [Pelobates cultripes]